MQLREDVKTTTCVCRMQVFMANIAHDATDDQIKEFAQQLGEVRHWGKVWLHYVAVLRGHRKALCMQSGTGVRTFLQALLMQVHGSMGHQLYPMYHVTCQ